MKNKATLGMLIVTILWGASFAVGKMAMVSVSPNFYTFFRFAGAFIVLAVVFYKKLLSANKEAIKAGCIIGIAVAIGYILQTMGLNYTTASKAGFLTGLYVVLVPVLETIFSRKFPRYNVVIGVILATVGLGVLSLEKGFNIGTGDIMVFIGAVSFALSMIFISKYAQDNDPMVLAIVQIGVTAFFSLILALTTEPMVSLSVFNLHVISLIIFAILFGTAVNTAVQNWAQGYLNATTAALIFVLEPVFSGVFGYFLLGDPIGLKQLLGGSLIVCGMLVTLLIKPKEKIK